MAAAALALLLVACGGTPTASRTSSPTAAPVAVSPQALRQLYGSYSMSDGDTVVIARLGWYFDMRDAAYRTMYVSASPDSFFIGSRFRVPLPRFADLVFSKDGLTVTTSTGSRTGRRVAYKRSSVRIPAQGATLAGEITDPIVAGSHPGIVVVHGAEPGQSEFYDIWVGIYASLGISVLTYDKRGIGSSTGVYPGETPTIAALNTYADDAFAALSFLRSRPGVDPKQVGFHGGSQGGWTVPLSMAKHGGGAFAILVSAPATTVGQTDLWAGFSGNGSTMPSDSTAGMLAQVRDDHSGYDPRPALAALNQPLLWVLGANDRTVPTAVCVEILDSLHQPQFTVHLVPTGHALLVNPTGLTADDDRSPGLAPDLVPTMKLWLSQTFPPVG